MEVPNFDDLGKNARDVFKTGYYDESLINFQVKTTSAKRLQMISDTILNFEEPKFSGSMETKYKANAAAMLLKWTTDGMLLLGYEFNGLLMKGVDLLSECTYNPETAAKSVKLGTKFTNEKINANGEISNDLHSGTKLLGSMVMKCKDIFFGYQSGYDTALNKVTKCNINVAYACNDLDIHFGCSCKSQAYGLSVLYKVNRDLDVVMHGKYTKQGNVPTWKAGAAAKCKIDEKSILRFKFNTDLQLATNLLQKLNDNIALILSFNIDCTNITSGNHRVGLALNVEA